MDGPESNLSQAPGGADPSGELLRITAEGMRAWWRKAGKWWGLSLVASIVLLAGADFVCTVLIPSDAAQVMFEKLGDLLSPLLHFLPYLIWWLAVREAQRLATAWANAHGARANDFTPLARFWLYATQAVPIILVIAGLQFVGLLLVATVGFLAHSNPEAGFNAAQELSAISLNLGSICKAGWLLCLFLAFQPRAQWACYAFAFYSLAPLALGYARPAESWPQSPDGALPLGEILALLLIAGVLRCLWLARQRAASQLLVLLFVLAPLGSLLRLVVDLSSTPRDLVIGLDAVLKKTALWTDFFTLQFGTLDPPVAPDTGVAALWLHPFWQQYLPASGWVAPAVVIFNLGLLLPIYLLLCRLATSARPRPAPWSEPAPDEGLLEVSP